MAVVPCLSTNVVALRVVASIASLNVAVTCTFLGDPVALAAGLVDVTVGAALVPGGLLPVAQLEGSLAQCTVLVKYS